MKKTRSSKIAEPYKLYRKFNAYTIYVGDGL